MKTRYSDAVAEAAARAADAGLLRPGEVYTIEVMHDDDCDILDGSQPCCCEPVVGTIRPVSGGPHEGCQ